MSSKPGWFPWIVAGVLAVVPAFAEAQQPVKLSALLTTFLADANVRTKGLQVHPAGVTLSPWWNAGHSACPPP